jgi:hypothetical protein
MVDGRIHCIGEAIALDGTTLTNSLGELVFQSACCKKQVWVGTGAAGKRSPVLINKLGRGNGQ